MHEKSSSGSPVVHADGQTNRQTYGKWDRRKLFAIFRTRLTSGSNYQDIARCVRHKASRSGIRSRLPTGESTETLGNHHRCPTVTQTGVFRLQRIPWAVASTNVPYPTWIWRVSLSAQTRKKLNCVKSELYAEFLSTTNSMAFDWSWTLWVTSSRMSDLTHWVLFNYPIPPKQSTVYSRI